MTEHETLIFRKYQHIQRWGHVENAGIEHGTCYIFPKLDGSNAQIWTHMGKVCAGCRTRELSANDTNAGFFNWVREHEGVASFLAVFPHLRLYGEWMVKHTIKTYRDSVWRQFYVFDVFDHQTGSLLPYEMYAPVVRAYHIPLIEPLCKFTNPTESNLVHEGEQNTYLIREGCGVGEGVVVKNYGYTNRFGNQVWAKWVRSEFKEQNRRAFGVCEKKGSKVIEAGLAEKFVTPTLVAKTRAKIELDVLDEAGCYEDSNRSKLSREEVLREARSQIIPRLLQTVYYEVVTEEIWAMLKSMGKSNQTIDFKKLRAHCILGAKKYAEDLF